MPESIHVLHSNVGPHGQGEWWRLIVEDDGRKVIEHQWSRTDASGRRGPDAGTERIPLDEFMSRGDDPELLVRINESLRLNP